MLLYALKSAIVLSLLYLPFILLLRGESFFRFNRMVLCGILVASIVLPLCNLSVLSMDANPVVNAAQMQMVEIGIPVAQGIVIEADAVAVQQEAQTAVSWFGVASTLYIIVAVVLLVMRMRDYMRLKRIIAHNCLWQKRQENGVTICCHSDSLPPFSWHRTIVISEDDYEKNAECIIGHELGHILNGHSIDIVLLTLVELVQWFNPLAWLLGHSLQDVHEYEADDHVLRSGVTIDEYRYLLIKKAVGTSAYAFANNFNHSLLKRRITMMCKKKSNPWRRAKALYVVPVALLALSAFATPTFVNSDNANTSAADSANVDITADTVRIIGYGTTNIPMQIRGMEPGKSPLILIDGEVASTEAFNTLQPSDIQSITVLKSDAAKTMYGDKGADGVILIETMSEAEAESPQLPEGETEVFEVVEHNPEFIGGEEALKAFIMSNMTYPKQAQVDEHQGKVLVSFVVGKDGKVYNARAMKCKANDALNKDLKDEAVRVVNMTSGQWTPGTQRGHKVNVKCVLPISFKLQ